VSFEVRAEEFVVLGPSGCGKTTLFNMIGALDTPTEGRLVVAGQDITRASRKDLFAVRRHGVSFVFQTFNVSNVDAADKTTSGPKPPAQTTLANPGGFTPRQLGLLRPRVHRHEL
jgi:ABC-type methionine transport system ATPase subunit